MTADRKTGIAAHRAAVIPAIHVLDRTPRECLRHITPIISARVVSTDDDPGWAAADVAAFQVSWKYTLATNGIIAPSTRGAGRTRWAGSIELDLVHPRMTRSAAKRALFQDLGVDVDALRPTDRIAVLHAHIVVDCRGHSSVHRLARDLRQAFPGTRRVHIGTLYDTGTVSANLDGIASYVTKHVSRYSSSWVERKTIYWGAYEQEWRVYVDKLYRRICYSKLLVSNVTPQRGECTVKGRSVERDRTIRRRCSYVHCTSIGRTGCIDAVQPTIIQDIIEELDQEDVREDQDMKMRDILMREDGTSSATIKTVKPSKKTSRDSYQSKAPLESRQQDGGSSRFQTEDHDPEEHAAPDEHVHQDGDDVVEHDVYVGHPGEVKVPKAGTIADPRLRPRPMPSIAPRPRKPKPRIRR